MIHRHEKKINHNPNQVNINIVPHLFCWAWMHYSHIFDVEDRMQLQVNDARISEPYIY